MISLFFQMLLLETVPERKSPCLKTMAWYKWAVGAYPTATFIAKTDDDAYVHTLKLEHNMRRFASNPHVYVGSTLWGSYIKSEVTSYPSCPQSPPVLLLATPPCSPPPNRYIDPILFG